MTEKETKMTNAQVCEECGAVAELLAMFGPCVLCAVCGVCGERGHLDSPCDCGARVCDASSGCEDCAAAEAARNDRLDREDAEEIARQTAPAPEEFAAAERLLLEAGAALRYVSRDQSRYYTLREREIRVSDHVVPQTAERDDRLGCGRTTSADFEVITRAGRDGSRERLLEVVLGEIRDVIAECMED